MIKKKTVFEVVNVYPDVSDEENNEILDAIIINIQRYFSGLTQK